MFIFFTEEAGKNKKITKKIYALKKSKKKKKYHGNFGIQFVMSFQVYSCGSNGKFQLGNGSDEDTSSLSDVFMTNIGVSKVVCGGNHTFLLLEDGEMLAAGDDDEGQCAKGYEKLGMFGVVPQIDGFKWIGVSAGFQYSLLLNSNQDLYSCGIGHKGELGLGEGIKSSLGLTKVEFDFPAEIIDIKSCLDHNLILLSNGDCYGFGNGRNNKLGELTTGKTWSPILVGKNISKIEIGKDFSVLVKKDGEFKVIGKFSYEIPEVKAVDIKTMWTSIHLITETGEIKSFGNNSHGQLVPNTRVEYDLIDTGSEHGIISKNGKVFTWGWGEHGNCGVQSSESVVFNEINEIYDFNENQDKEGNKEKVIAVFGGCATTWVVTKKES